jgi:hypothetical protein
VCLCIPPIVGRQRLCKNPFTIARQRLGKSSLIVARQRFGKNPLIVARQWLDRNITAVTNTHATIEELLDASFSMWPCRMKESRRLVLPRTSCFVHGCCSNCRSHMEVGVTKKSDFNDYMEWEFEST